MPCIGTFTQKYRGELEEFIGPVLSGIVVTSMLWISDLLIPEKGEEGARATRFIASTIKHVDSQILVFGIWLLCVCLLLTGWPPILGIRRLVVLPFLRFCHHLVLVSAGAVVVMAVNAAWVNGFLRSAPEMAYALFLLTTAGLEMQVGIRYCLTNPNKLNLQIAVWAQILSGAVGLIILSRILYQQLQKGH